MISARLGRLALVLLLAAGAPFLSAREAPPPAYLAGTWVPVRNFGAALRTVEGKTPPLNAAGQALHEQRRKVARSGDPVRQCLRPGTPRVLFQNRPLMVLQTPRKVTFVHEFQHVLRHVYIDESLPPPEELEPTWGGTAVGHWESGALVVDTAGFHDGLWLDATGLPQSAAARVTERVRMLDGDRLEILVTLDDPVYYTAPWQVRATYRRADGLALREHICAETLLEPALKRTFLKHK